MNTSRGAYPSSLAHGAHVGIPCEGAVCTWSWLCDFRQLAHLVDERCHYRRKSNRKVHDLFRSRGQFAVVLLVVDPGRIKFDGAVGRPTSLHTKITMESGLGL